MKKLKNNKGLSLIELLVSLVILSISLLGIINLISSGTKINKKSEIKQQGLVLGQQTLEEMQLLSKGEGEITSEEIILPGGLKLEGAETNQSGNTLSDTLVYNSENGGYKVKDSNYNVEVKLEKNNISNQIDDSSEEQSISAKTLDLKTDNRGDIIICVDGIEKQKIDYSSNIYIKVVKDTNMNKVYLCDNKDKYICDMNDNKIMFNFTTDCKLTDDVTINIENYLSDTLNIYIKKSSDFDKNVNVKNELGSISVTDNIIDETQIKKMNDIGNLYEITVRIKNNDEEVFKGYANKNLKFNIKSNS